MTDIRDRLRDADPLLTDPGLSPDDVARMRRAVLDAAQAPPRETGLRWTKTLPIAAAVALMAGAGIDTARRVSRQTPLPAAAAAAPVATAGTKTQVHFSTPGGTRIIWTIDPAFTLTENR
jgi:hypothetical protein